MRGDRGGKPLYRFGGDDLDSQQRMAVLYVLMPELFKGTKDGDAAIIAAQAKGAAESDAATIKDFAAGTYTIDAYHSSDVFTPPLSTARSPSPKPAKCFVMDFKLTQGDPLQGVAIQNGSELWAAVGLLSSVWRFIRSRAATLRNLVQCHRQARNFRQRKPDRRRSAGRRLQNHRRQGPFHSDTIYRHAHARTRGQEIRRHRPDLHGRVGSGQRLQNPEVWASSLDMPR